MLIDKNTKRVMLENTEIKRIMSEGGVMWEKKKIYNIDKFINDSSESIAGVTGPLEIYNANIHKFRLTFGPNTPTGLIDKTNSGMECVNIQFGSRKIKTNNKNFYTISLNRMINYRNRFTDSGGVFEWVSNNEFVFTMPPNCVFVIDGLNAFVYANYYFYKHGISKEQFVKNLDVKLEVLEVIN